MTTSAHLMRLGFDVEFVDLEGTGRFDFLLRRDGVELDAECKMVSCDIGRKIPRVPAIELLHRINKEIKQFAGKMSGGRCIYIRIEDRLEADQTLLENIVRLAGRTLRTGVSDQLPGVCTTSLLDFSFADSPFNAGDPDNIALDQVRQLSKRLIGNDNPQLSVFFTPGRLAVLTIVESERTDRVLEAIFEVLSESAKNQLSRQRPGAMFVQLHDLSAHAIQSLAEQDTLDPAVATGLQIAATRFFASADRRHVHTLSFRSHGNVARRTSVEANIQSTITSEEGLSYVFKNPNNPFAEDELYRVLEHVPREAVLVRP